MLSGGDSIKQVGKGQLVFHCSADTWSPGAFQYCLSGKGGEGGVVGVCGVWELSGWYQGVVKGVIVPKQMRKDQLLPYHAMECLFG